MKRKLLCLLLCAMSLTFFLFNRWLPLQTVVFADIATGDGNQPIDYGGDSDFDPGLKSERHFYTDVGGDLDKYLYRDDLQATGGRLTFEIDIDRYFSSKISAHVDPVTGLLPPNIVTDLVK